ncbi:hypothetical protein BH24ACT5_BH24ACT5_16680 [soil metagenome]
MTRVRVSTTVDGTLLATARQACGNETDATLIDAALAALLRAMRATKIDQRTRSGYDAHPLDAPDEYGDLESWLEATK